LAPTREVGAYGSFKKIASGTDSTKRGEITICKKSFRLSILSTSIVLLSELCLGPGLPDGLFSSQKSQFG
jgi:hypothetical protein